MSETGGVTSLQSELPFSDRLLRIARSQAADTRVQEVFGLTSDEIERYILGTRISDEGVVISPHFESPGFGANTSNTPVLVQSDLDPSDDALEHEANHALHYGLCRSYFTSEDALSHLSNFNDEVLADDGFCTWLKGMHNLQQQEMIAQAKTLVETAQSQVQVENKAGLLGAITYWHAFYVDPGMCEAVASSGNDGHIRIVNALNRFLGTLLIPGRDPLEGYGNKKYQDLFARASLQHKVLLVRKDAYIFSDFWK